jgi:hypothetical protein
VDARNRLMHEEVDLGEQGYHAERSSVNHLGTGRGRGEPDVVLGDPEVGPWVLEVIQVGC